MKVANGGQYLYYRNFNLAICELKNFPIKLQANRPMDEAIQWVG
jgi:hypothetical protein